MVNRKKLGRLKAFLEEKVEQYNQPEFIKDDPISIPRRFSKKQDIEISGFIAASLAWGNRLTILNNCNTILQRMDNAPFDFICNHVPSDLVRFKGIVHRTFNYDDLVFFITALQRLYQQNQSLEHFFTPHPGDSNLKNGIHQFRVAMFETEHLPRSEKHVSDPLKNSACKRLNMYLRWMVRNDDAGVDFGIWKNIKPGLLSCPLDVHSGRIARDLGLLNRKQNDWKAVEELDTSLRTLDALDPVKYDFALFGIGVNEKRT